jgi:glutamate dehydrogenase/leucine dehydrogenase
VNPKELSEGELERLSRGYVRELYKYLGPETDVPAPDVNTNPKIMSWMMDEYSLLAGKYSPGSFTGKPLTSGGSLGRNKATAQ